MIQKAAVRGKNMTKQKRKIIYLVALTNPDLINSKSSGISKKIDWQIAALSDAGIKVRLVKRRMQSKYRRAMPFQTSTIDWAGLKHKMGCYDGLYHRHVNTDFQMLKLFCEIKKQNPKFKIILELPTYPYDGERKKGLLYYRDRHYRKQLKKYADRIVIFDQHKDVWGVPAIQTCNGIDLSGLRIKKQEQRTDTFDICMVADFEYWHGADRLLRGLLAYYANGGRENIRLHFVGGVSNTRILEKYKQAASHRLIRHKVFFYGNLEGEELDHIYDICHLAAASLGRHRTGVFLSSEIKTREYMGKGIPFIYSTEIDVFRESHVDFAYQIPADDSPVDLNEVTAFYKRLLDGYKPDQLSREIRQFARDKVSMNQAMKPIAEYFLSES